MSSVSIAAPVAPLSSLRPRSGKRGFSTLITSHTLTVHVSVVYTVCARYLKDRKQEFLKICGRRIDCVDYRMIGYSKKEENSLIVKRWEEGKLRTLSRYKIVAPCLLKQISDERTCYK